MDGSNGETWDRNSDNLPLEMIGLIRNNFTHGALSQGKGRETGNEAYRCTYRTIYRVILTCTGGRWALQTDSFIQRIYIAPLLGAYSESLQAQPRLNREDIRSCQKAGILLRGIKRSSSGSPFQVEDPTIEKARRCQRDMNGPEGQEALPWARGEEPDGWGANQKPDDRGQKGRTEHNQRDTAKLTMLPCKRCAAG